jgi:hypothetical protein
VILAAVGRLAVDVGVTVVALLTVQHADLVDARAADLGVREAATHAARSTVIRICAEVHVFVDLTVAIVVD